MESTKLSYQPHIDGLRALAVLLVIAFHAFPDAVRSGFVGVDIFFVISGFLISKILLADFGRPGTRALVAIRDFYGRRVRRIFPSLLVVLVFCYAVGWGFMLPSEFKALAKHITASAAFCQNLILATETGYFNRDATTKPLLHIWSLGIEEQFYFVWPVLLLLACKSRVRLLPVIVFLAALSFFWNESKSEVTAAAAFYLPQMRAWELMIGAIAAIIDRPGQDDRPRSRMAGGLGDFPNATALLGSLLLCAGLLLIKNDQAFPNWLCLFPTLGTALLILAGDQAWINRWFLSRRVLVWIGLISYPLYLWHWPLLLFSSTFYGGSHVLAAKLVAILLATVLAWMCYRWIEIPIRHGGRRLGKTIALAAPMLGLGGAAHFTYLHAGFPARFPPFVQELANFSFDYATAWRQGTGFLVHDQDETAFNNDRTVIAKDKPTLYLWGDSHAAQLYPGYVTRYGANQNIIQRTAAAIPPLVGVEIPNQSNGKNINDFVLDEIKRDKPDSVVLAANWEAYDWKQIGTTIAALRAAGIHHIVVVGPTPQWIGGLPQQILNFCKLHRLGSIPVRLRTGVSELPLKTDRQMEEFCRKLGVEYISPCRIMGNEEGFITRVGDGVDSLVAFDYGHLTKVGSDYLVANFPAER